MGNQHDKLVDEFIMNIPEDGGSVEFNLGDTIINFDNGTFKRSDGEIQQLQYGLQKRGFKYMHSFSIGADRQIHYQIEGMKKRIINAHHSETINNISFKSVKITCDDATNVQVMACTHPQPDIGLSINYKIDDQGRQYVLAGGNIGLIAQDIDKRVYTKPVGDQELPFQQCCAGRILTLDEYQYINKRSHIPATTYVGTRIGDSPSGIPDAAFGILQNAAILQPPNAMQMELVSTDAADTQTIRLEYFDEATWTYAYEDVVLTGLSAVNTVATDIYRIDNMSIIKGGPAVGNITLKDTGAVNLYGQISPLRTFMERALHYVRRGYRTTVSDVIVGTQTKEGIIFRLFRTMQYGSDIVTTGRFSVSLQGTNMSHAFNITMAVENPDGLRMAVGMGVLGLAAAQGATASFRYFNEVI